MDLKKLLLLVVALAAAPEPPIVDRTCSSSTTLDALATCIRTQMPQSGSNGFVAPSAAEQADWRTAVAQMLGGACNFPLPGTLNGVAQIRTFTDSSNSRDYCLLMEVADANNNGFVDRGWGTFITYNGATRELSHLAPHPISDSTTELQAIGVFRDTGSRSYLMAGARASAGQQCVEHLPEFVRPGGRRTQHRQHVSRDEPGADGLLRSCRMECHSVARHGGGYVLEHGRLHVARPQRHPCRWRSHLRVANERDVAPSGMGRGPHWSGRLQFERHRQHTGSPTQRCPSGKRVRHGGDKLHRHVHSHRTGSRIPDRCRLDWPCQRYMAGRYASHGTRGSSNLTATATSSSQVTLSWADNSSNEDGFKIERSLDNNAFTEIATVPASATGGVDTALAAATTYYYRVRAFNGVGTSAYSNTASATTLNPPLPTPPAAPTNLAAQTTGHNIKLNWTASSSPNVTHIRVHRSTVNGGPYALIATIPVATTYTNTGLTKGTTYHYVVSAVNSSGLVSAYSNQASKTAK